MAVEQRQAGQLLLHGIVGGIVAGIVFIIAETLIAVVLGAPILAPLALISTIVLGTEALAPGFPLITAVTVGLMVHAVMSAIFGIIFVYLLALANQLAAPASLLLLYGAIYGLALWIVNFFIIGALFFPQFLMVDQFWQGFVPHVLFYGLMLAGYVAAVRPGVFGAPMR